MGGVGGSGNGMKLPLLVSRELNHMAAILHVYARGLVFKKKKKNIIIFQKGKCKIAQIY